MIRGEDVCTRRNSAKEDAPALEDARTVISAGRSRTSNCWEICSVALEGRSISSDVSKDSLVFPGY